LLSIKSKIFDNLDNEISDLEIKDLINKFMLMDDCLYDKDFKNDYNTVKEIIKEKSSIYVLKVND